jgi:hypothetical protein
MCCIAAAVVEAEKNILQPLDSVPGRSPFRPGIYARCISGGTAKKVLPTAENA